MHLTKPRAMKVLGLMLTATIASAGGAPCALAAPSNAPAAVVAPASCAKPVYPKAALRMEAEGTVSLEFRIGADGKVLESRLVESSGIPLLDSAARSALEKCKFKAKLVQGKAEESWLPLKYVWSLDGPAPRKPAPPEPFAQAPVQIRAFILQAKRADAIIDPLQRCLAFPDFPGNRWPRGLAAGYCHLKFGEWITEAVIADHIERGAIRELEDLYRRDLDLHLSKENFSEVIHSDFLAFHASEKSERLSRLWLEKAPDSPFANVARGEYLTAMAREARGAKWYGETPKDALAKMEDFANRAISHYAKALNIEPRMQHALNSLVYLSGFVAARPSLDSAFERSEKLDPACRYLSRLRMTNLQPRWGGSMAEMHAYASSLQRYVADRPLVALSQVLPAMEEARLLTASKKDAEGIPILEAATGLAPYPDLFESLGLSMDDANADQWQTLVRLLVAYRYDDGGFGAGRARGQIMLDAHDPAWALKSVLQGVRLKPESPYSHYLVGKTYYSLGKYALAEPYLAKGMGDEGLYKDSLYHLAYATLQSVQLEKADGHAALIVKTYPKEARAWLLAADVKRAQDNAKDAVTALDKFIALADNDKAYSQQVEYARAFIKQQSGAKAAGMK